MSNVTVKEENGEDRSEHLDQRKKRFKTRLHKCKECSKTFAYPCYLKDHILTQHLNERSIVCRICKKGFNTRTLLKQHLLIVHVGTRHYNCNLCCKSFLHKTHLTAHFKKHSGIKNFVCSICKKAFSQKQHLKQHMNIHLGINPYKCQFCGLEFNTGTTLRNHVRTHTKEKPYKCCICTYHARQQPHLKSHLQTHIKKPPFNCILCEIKYDEQNDLLQHLYQHCKDEYICKICPGNVFFNTSQKLEYHINLCHNEQAWDGTEINPEHQLLPDTTTLGIEDDEPLQCCGLEFSSIQKLKMHIRHHYREISSQNEDVSSTTICNMDPDIDNHSSQVIKRENVENIATTQDDELTLNLEEDNQIPEQLNQEYLQLNQESNINLIDKIEEIKVKCEPSIIKNIGKCSLCNEAFTDRAKLKSHFKLEHFGKNSFGCAKCRKTFSKASFLEDHFKMHQKQFNPGYSCKICCHQYNNIEDLRRDVQKHLGMAYSCENCGSSFQKIKKLIKHCTKNVCSDQTINTFTCMICSKRFEDSEVLKIHALKHFGSPNYYCSVCYEDFRLCQDLVKHVEDKHGKPFMCNLCCKIFTLSADLNEHIKEKHMVKFPYACILCDLRVSTIKQLKIHSKDEH